MFSMVVWYSGLFNFARPSSAHNCWMRCNLSIALVESFMPLPRQGLDGLKLVANSLRLLYAKRLVNPARNYRTCSVTRVLGVFGVLFQSRADMMGSGRRPLSRTWVWPYSCNLPCLLGVKF